MDGRDLHPGLARVLLRDLEARLGDVVTGHVPALRGEEDRVAALAHGDVERLPRLHPLDHGRQELARRGGEPILGLLDTGD
jgi:hypothetical protein